MRFALCLLLASCATIPGTDVRVPDAEHDGWHLAACGAAMSSDPDCACCWYARDDRLLTVCTRDGGYSWDLVDDDGAVEEESL